MVQIPKTTMITILAAVKMLSRYPCTTGYYMSSAEMVSIPPFLYYSLANQYYIKEEVFILNLPTLIATPGQLPINGVQGALFPLSYTPQQLINITPSTEFTKFTNTFLSLLKLDW